MYEEGGVRACEIGTVTLACIPTAPRPRPPWTWSGRMPAVAPAQPGAQGARHGYWFPLLLFGGLAALWLPLSVLASPRPATGFAILTREIYPTVTQAMYFGGGSAARRSPVWACTSP